MSDTTSTPSSGAEHAGPAPETTPGDRPEELPADARPLPAPLPAERGLEPADALARYTAELRKYPPISREEEHALAVRWVEEGDVEAARKLVVSNLRLVVKIAMQYRRNWTNVLDLIQEGNLGLMQAVQRFDPYQGVKLSSYGVYWIRAFILKYLMDNIRLVRVGGSRAQRKLFFRLNKEKRELERLGFEVEPKLLAERLDVSESDVIEMEQRLGEQDLSLDAPMRRDDSHASVGDFVSDAQPSAEERVADAELRRVFLEKVHDFVEELGEREREIVELRILAEEPLTLQELGERFGVSRERVRQLEARLVTRLRDFLKDQVVDFEFYRSED